jgi:L-fuculokinase
MGIHDSNASLLPHLAKRRGGDFILNSTGTWCVLMHPQESYGFSPDELGKIVFFNRSAFNKPVKTAIFLGGMEYEAWSRAIGKASGRESAERGASPPEPSLAAYRSVVAARSEFILPELVPGSGQFPGSRPRAIQAGRDYALADIESGASAPGFVRDGERAMAALNLSLAFQTGVALERAGLGRATEVFTEGGFRKNAGYTALLASALASPGGGEGRAFVTDIPEATALGAAMTALAAFAGGRPDELGGLFDIDYRRVAPMAGLAGFEAYRAAWLEAAAMDGGKA